MSVSEPSTGRRRREGATPAQSETPYLDALQALRRTASRVASTCPATRAGEAVDPGLSEAFGERRPEPRHTGAHAGHRPGPRAHALPAGPADGGRRLGGPPHVVPGQRSVTGQPRGAADARAPRAASWWSSATRTRARSTRSSSPGCARPSWRPSSTRSCTSPTASPRTAWTPRCGRRPGPWARPRCRPPTSEPSPTSRGWPRWPTPTGCRWWSTRPGAPTSPSTPACRRPRSHLGRTSWSPARTRWWEASPRRPWCTWARTAASTTSSWTAA